MGEKASPWTSNSSFSDSVVSFLVFFPGEGSAFTCSDWDGKWQKLYFWSWRALAFELCLKMVKLEFVRTFWFHICGKYLVEVQIPFLSPEGPCFFSEIVSSIGEGIWQGETLASVSLPCLVFSEVLATGVFECLLSYTVSLWVGHERSWMSLPQPLVLE